VKIVNRSLNESTAQAGRSASRERVRGALASFSSRRHSEQGAPANHASTAGNRFGGNEATRDPSRPSLAGRSQSVCGLVTRHWLPS